MLAGARLKRLVTISTLVLALLVGAIGTACVVVALRPCHLDLAPGTVLTYQIRTESRRLEDGVPAGESAVKVNTQEITLVCLDRGNRVALLSPGAPGSRDEICLMELGPDGSARRLDDALRPLEDGKAVGFFDFNLLRLPQGMEQNWITEVPYAVLPPGRRLVQCKVRCLENGMNPTYRLTPKAAIEWVDDGNGRRYVQLRDLVCRYAFNRGKGLVDTAEMRFIASRETDQGVLCHDVRVTIALTDAVAHGQEAAATVADLALSTVRAQSLMEDGRSRALLECLEKLRAADALHPRLQRLVEDLRRDAAGTPAVRTGWSVQVLSVSAGRATEIEPLARTLCADGFPAAVRRQGPVAVLVVGPYAERDPRILAALGQRFPASRPYWMQSR